MVTVIRELPKKAGTARIIWDEAQPRRDNSDIYLPLEDGGVYLPLLKDQQFLFKFEDIRNRHTKSYWFGGTDEEPFLVQIEDKAFGAYLKGGEELFYRALKPQGIRFLEDLLKSPSQRQGDIFAVPLGKRKDIDLHRTLWQVLRLNEDDPKSLERIEDYNLFDTRHTITGFGYSMPRYFIRGMPAEIATGIIRAPDHRDLKLNEENIYFLAQTNYLVNPKLAD